MGDIRDNPLDDPKIRKISIMDGKGLKDKLALLKNTNAQNLPFIYLIKDQNFRFQFMTNLSAQHTGFSDASESANLTAADLKCEAVNHAKELFHYDRMTMETRSETLLLSLIHSAMGATVSLICNKPIINDKNEVEGVETWAQVLPSSVGLDKIIQGYNGIETELVNHKNDPHLLTLREQECVYYLVRGCTFLEIAQKLFISARTVESHITNIKHKLGVNTRSELIVKACELGYVQINLLDPNLQPGKLQLLGLKPFNRDKKEGG